MSTINTNIGALTAQYNMKRVNTDLEKAMERLSSGLRINSAADDAAGLAIANRMESQVRGLQAAIKNANDGISLTQVAEGAMQEVTNILQRMRELAVQSANDSNTSEDRAFLQAEVEQLTTEITRIAETTQFNSMSVLDGTFTDKQFQIGSNSGQTVGITLGNLSAASLGVNAVSSSNGVSESTTVLQGGGDEVARVTFSGDDTYSFKLVDEDTGLSFAILKDDFSSMSGDYAKLTAGLVSTASDTITLTGHGYATGDKLTFGTEALATSNSNVGYVIKIDDDTFQVATTRGNAIAGQAGDLTAVAATFKHAGLDLNLEDSNSIEAFVDRINLGLKESAVNTSLAANANAALVNASTVDATDADNDAKLKFQITVDGVTKEIDIKDRLLGLASDTSAATADEIAEAARKELRSEFDSSLNVSNSSGVLTVSDSQGRAMSIRQGEGNGFIFGPDVQNTGADALDVAASTANNLSVAFEDGDLVITHAEAGAMSLTSFTSTNASTAVFNVADSANAAQRDPIVLQDTAASNEITVRGSAAASGLTLNFSNTYGWAVSGDLAVSGAMSSIVVAATPLAAGNITASIAAFSGFEATYSFKITDGSGNVYADLSGASELDLQRYQNTDAAIKLAVETALSAGIAANFTNDNQIAMSDFTVAYDNGQLSITSASGRRLAVEQFSSKFGYADAVGANGGATEKLSSQSRQATEIRLQRGTGAVTAPQTAALEFWIEGLTAEADFLTVDLTTMVDGTTATDHPLEQAVILESEFRANVSDDITVSYDYDTDEFVIHNPTGAQLDLRRITISAGFEDSLIKDLSTFSSEGEATTVAIKSSVEQGAVRDATSLTMTFSQDALDGVSFKLNNNSISASNFNFATDDFASSTFKSNIESVLDTLNSDYPSDVIGYSMDLATRTLTFTHADGAALKLTDFAATSETMVAEVTDVLTGTSTTFDNVEVKQEASATGDRDPAAAVEVTVDGSASASSSSSSSLAQVTVATSEGALAALDSIDAALSFILEQRGMVGALENRLSHTISNLSNVVLNTEAAKGRIVDADFASETSNLTKNQILQQAATSMLAQANQAKQGILALLQ